MDALLALAVGLWAGAVLVLLWRIEGHLHRLAARPDIRIEAAGRETTNALLAAISSAVRPPMPPDAPPEA
jgi:hypothetical protein